MAKIFNIPFATTGDREPIPQEAQEDNHVSYAEGYTEEYGLDPATSAEALDIERTKFNGLVHDITEAIFELQRHGVALWSADAAPYPAEARVYYSGAVWSSQSDNNSQAPGEGSAWVRDEVVSQAEAEAGTATTRRAWTAQRVRQAIVAGYNAITSAFGRTLANASNATAARNTLGLGTAATRDVTTELDDLTAGRLATIEQVRRHIGDPYADYARRVILLHPVHNGGSFLPLHIVDGAISAFRGSTSTLNIAEKVYVVSSSSYNNNNIRLFSVGSGPSSTWEPVTCLYGGTKYIALKMPYTAPGYTRGAYFEGRIYSQSNDPNILKIVDYYNEQSQTVLNAEIYNSITPAPAADYFRIGNSIAYHTGNIARLISDANLVQTSDIGTAASKDVGTSPGDVMEVGAFGLGSRGALLVPTDSLGDREAKCEFLYWGASPSDISKGEPNAAAIYMRGNVDRRHAIYVDNAGRLFTWTKLTAETNPVNRALLDDSMVSQSTGQSTSSVMSQKAVTDSLNTVNILPVTASRTLVLADAGAMLNCTAAAGLTLTIPAGVFPVGAVVLITHSGTSGAVTVAAGPGVTLQPPEGTAPRTRDVQSTVGIVQLATDRWRMFGDLADA